MQNSLFLARLGGPVLTLVGLAILFRPRAFRDVLHSFQASPATLYLTGFLAVLGSMALVLTHNLWVLDWRLIITVAAWVGVLKGAVILLQPQPILSLARWFAAHQGAILAIGAMNSVIGLVLCYFGYWA
ncbi:MAG: hypothetical protein WCC64_21955 [Aliidongia sp.]